MAGGDTRARTGLSTFLLASTALVWISAVIVMGILAYLVSKGWGGDHVIYELVMVCDLLQQDSTRDFPFQKPK
jgi:hypothetical protein